MGRPQKEGEPEDLPLPVVNHSFRDKSNGVIIFIYLSICSFFVNPLFGGTCRKFMVRIDV